MHTQKVSCHMLVLKVYFLRFLGKIKIFLLSLTFSLMNTRLVCLNHVNLIYLIISIGIRSLGISVVTAGFIGMVFTLQIAKEFLYLNASNFIGAILSLAFIRELSPVFIGIIASSKIGSSFTAELATMKSTEQIDALYLLKTDPFVYLVLPRMLALSLVLPLLNILFMFTSLSSGLAVSFILYDIHPWIFLNSSIAALSFLDFIKSSFKSIFFALVLSVNSCAWGLTANGGSKTVGRFTTLSSAMSLLLIFIFDFILTWMLFGQDDSALRFLWK